MKMHFIIAYNARNNEVINSIYKLISLITPTDELVSVDTQK